MKNNEKMLMSRIIRNYPKDNHFQYTLTQNNIENDTMEFLKKEFYNTKYTLSKEIIHPFIEDVSTTHIKINAFNIELHCVGPFNDIPPLLFLLKIIKRIVCICKIFNINKTYTIWLLPIKEQRYFPSHGEIVKPVHINGGYTYVNGTTIIIYRFEECAKVILHEILHHSPYDTYNKWSNSQILHIRELFNIDEQMVCNINESIVEFWATIYQLMFISYEYHTSFNMLLNKEKEWTEKQTIRLLQYQEEHFTHANKKWYEDSNAYFYIVIKAIFLLNYTDFTSIPLPYSTDNVLKFIEIHYRQILDLKHKKIKSNTNSMRMTLLGDM